MTIAGAMWNHGPQMWSDMSRRGIPMVPLTKIDTRSEAFFALDQPRVETDDEAAEAWRLELRRWMLARVVIAVCSACAVLALAALALALVHAYA